MIASFSSIFISAFSLVILPLITLHFDYYHYGAVLCFDVRDGLCILNIIGDLVLSPPVHPLELHFIASYLLPSGSLILQFGLNC